MRMTLIWLCIIAWRRTSSIPISMVMCKCMSCLWLDGMYAHMYMRMKYLHHKDLWYTSISLQHRHTHAYVRLAILHTYTCKVYACTYHRAALIKHKHYVIALRPADRRSRNDGKSSCFSKFFGNAFPWSAYQFLHHLAGIHCQFMLSEAFILVFLHLLEFGCQALFTPSS